VRRSRLIHTIRITAAAAAIAAVTAACGGTASENSGGVDRNKGDKGSIKVGSANFTEALILANMYADVLANAGYKTSTQAVDSSDQLLPGLSKGDPQVMPGYVATYADQLNRAINGADAKTVASSDLDKTYAALKELAAKRNQVPLKPSKAVDQNAFAVSKKFAKEHHLKTLSDLGKSGIPVKIAAGSDCAQRPFCEPGLKKVYGIKSTGVDPLGVDTLQTKQAVAKGADQLALVLTTDATVDDAGLVVLTDDKKLQNADYVVPLVNKDALKPPLEKALNQLSATLTTKDLAELNAKVDVEQQKPNAVASDYLKAKKLIKS
jgi:osmoprotectant transport system substrate-binding protein